MYKSDKIYMFTNWRFEEQGYKDITKERIQKHHKAYQSGTFKEFEKARVLYLFNNICTKKGCKDIWHHGTCECHDYWHYGVCKHFIAAKLDAEEIKVGIKHF
jgi:hypothetical protein